MEHLNAIVIEAEGWCGDFATVWFCGTVEQCRNFIGRSRGYRIIARSTRRVGAKISCSTIADMVGGSVWEEIPVRT